MLPCYATLLLKQCEKKYLKSFLPKWNIPQIFIFDYNFNKNVKVEYKDCIKYLGVLIDENLSWKNHVDSVIIKISKNVGMLSKLRQYIQFYVFIKVHNALITPLNHILLNSLFYRNAPCAWFTLQTEMSNLSHYL